MKITNEWIRLSLAIGMYLSCAMLALSIFYIYIEFNKLGYVPTRFFIIVPICCLVLSLVLYFSEERAWITALRLLLYVFMLVSMMVGIFGLRVLLNIILGEPASVSMYSGGLALGSGSAIFWLLLKLANSKWLENA